MEHAGHPISNAYRADNTVANQQYAQRRGHENLFSLLVTGDEMHEDVIPMAGIEDVVGIENVVGAPRSVRRGRRSRQDTVSKSVGCWRVSRFRGF